MRANQFAPLVDEGESKRGYMRVTTSTLGSEITAVPGEKIGSCDVEEVRELVKRHGWVYFRQFHPALEEFEAFAKAFGRCTSPRVIHYPPGGVALGFHAEDSYNLWRPDTLWFVCLAEGTDGGAPTGVLDAVRLLQDMNEEWRSFSRGNHLRFKRTWASKVWQGAVGGDDRGAVAAYLDELPGVTHTFLSDGSLQAHYSVPMVVRTEAGAESFSNTVLHAVKDQPFYGMTLADGSPVPADLVEHVEELALRSEITIGWEQGDVAVIDNYRLMHRRGEYGGSGRDLRALHGEEFFDGTKVPVAKTELQIGAKALLQGDIV